MSEDDTKPPVAQSGEVAGTNGEAAPDPANAGGEQSKGREPDADPAVFGTDGETQNSSASSVETSVSSAPETDQDEGNDLQTVRVDLPFNGLVTRVKLTAEQRQALRVGTLAHWVDECRAVSGRCTLIATGFRSLAEVTDDQAQKDRLDYLAKGFDRAAEGILGEIEGL